MTENFTMQIIDRGLGPPLLLIPGIQGRWEYVGPAVGALADRFRVITFPLCGERRCRLPFDSVRGLDNFIDQIDTVLDDRGLPQAVICGISFGGLAALRFAARRPERTAALILVSTPGPGWHLKGRHRIYAALPWLFGPFLLAEAPFRLGPEIAAAMPDRPARWRFICRQLSLLVRAPMSLSQMAARAKLIETVDLQNDCERVSAPTLVISGEPGLDHVVPVGGTSLYARLVPGARAVRLQHTGHLGSITRPDEFARIVAEFVQATERQRSRAAAGGQS